MRPEHFAPLGRDDAAYLWSQVESFEPDWLLPVPYVDETHRSAWLSLLAFGAEVIGTPGRVSNGMLGRIRLQWWREAVGEIFGEGRVRAHPVVGALALLVRGHEPLASRLLALIDGMEPFLEPGGDVSVEQALTARASYHALGSALCMVADLPPHRNGLALHSLCRIAPDATAIPAEDGTETAAKRFSRFLGSNPVGEPDLANALCSYRAERPATFDLASLPLRLFRPRPDGIARIKNPLAQKSAILLGVLTGKA